MLGMVQEQLARRPLWLPWRKQDGEEREPSREGEGGSQSGTRGTLEARKDSVLSWETTRRWRQRPEKLNKLQQAMLSMGSGGDRKQVQEQEKGLEPLQRQQSYIAVEPHTLHPTGFTHRLGTKSKKGRLASTSRSTVCRGRDLASTPAHRLVCPTLCQSTQCTASHTARTSWTSAT